MWWLEQGFNQLEDSPRQGLVPPVHMACPVWHQGDLRIEPREAAVWCSRWALVVSMEIANTAETQRKGTCLSSEACLKMNEKQVEFRIAPQLVVPHGVLISFSFLCLLVFQRIDWKQGYVIEHIQASSHPDNLGVDVYSWWCMTNRIGDGGRARRVLALLVPVCRLSLGFSRHLGICLQHMRCC